MRGEGAYGVLSTVRVQKAVDGRLYCKGAESYPRADLGRNSEEQSAQ